MERQYTGEGDLATPDALLRYLRHPWRKNQLSDHFPIWVEVVINSSDDFLREKRDALVASMDGGGV